jgi:AbrB family looped-hinge helix DNA binding protein
MKKLYSTISSKGQLVVPAAIRESLGLTAGTRVGFLTEGNRVILEPETLAAKLRLIDELQGLTAGGPSMTDSLLAERRREREIELAKDGW